MASSENFHSSQEKTEAGIFLQEEALGVISRATLFPKLDERFDVSFTTLMLALLLSDDEASLWFRNTGRRLNVNVNSLLRNLFQISKLDEGTFKIIRNSATWDYLRKTSFSPTSSIMDILEIAAEISSLDKTSGKFLVIRGEELSTSASSKYKILKSNKCLQVRHIIAGVLYDEWHARDLENWGIVRSVWSNELLEYLTFSAPGETEKCRELHCRIFPESPPFNTDGISSHLATDVWTTEDCLGYRYYARAIAAFMSHKDTGTPLCISIQAPWGGGKTSLMRMLQAIIDPVGYERRGQNQPSDGLEIKKNKTPNVIVQQELTVCQVERELDTWDREPEKPALPTVPLMPPPIYSKVSKPLLTIWFNAWKYESTNQVWSGLADAIMQQVAGRFNTIVEREFFWLRLHLKRIDTEKVRRKIYERSLSYVWRFFQDKIIPILFSVFLFIVALFGFYHEDSAIPEKNIASPPMNASLAIGSLGVAGSLGSFILIFSISLYAAKRKVENEPAAMSLGDLLKIPNYQNEIGFLHHAESDLRLVLDSIPRSMRPIVIFIDDLDRCSPGKVAQVIEAVNLFLAGEFPECLFVLGMDSELVASALDVAHKEMIEHLPPDARAPLGWRFMDKFVQLPFTIPPIHGVRVEKYVDTLFKKRIVGQFAEREVAEEARSGEEHVREEFTSEEELERRLDAGIRYFSDKDPEIMELIRGASVYFHGNPREYKRFVNAFRFHYYLWWAARVVQGERDTSLEQLQRWTVFCLKWPEVMRWMRRSSLVLADGNRLRMLERIAGESGDFSGWQAAVAKKLTLDPANVPWLRDKTLHAFIVAESLRPDGTRLSDGVGKGVW